MNVSRAPGGLILLINIFSVKEIARARSLMKMSRHEDLCEEPKEECFVVYVSMFCWFCFCLIQISLSFFCGYMILGYPYPSIMFTYEKGKCDLVAAMNDPVKQVPNFETKRVWKKNKNIRRRMKPHKKSLNSALGRVTSPGKGWEKGLGRATSRGPS